MPRGRLLIALLAAVTATGPLAMQIFVPALPAIAAGFAVPAGVAQLALSLSMVAIALAQLAYGPLADRYGRRPVMLAGMVIFLVGSLLCALAGHIGVLILGRVIQAAGGAAGMVLARAVVRDVYGAERAAAVIAQLTMVMVIAPMVAPAIGGVLTDTVGWRGVFWAVTALAVIVVAMVWRALGESRPQGTEPEGVLEMLRGFGLLAASPVFRGYALQTAFASVIFFSFISGAPYVMVEVLERPATEYGLFFMLTALAFMAGNFVAMRLARHIDTLVMAAGGALLGLLGVALTCFVVWLGPLTPWTLFGPVLIAFVGNGVAMPNAQAGAINVFPHRAGTASGFTGFLQMTFAAAASQMVGVLQNGTPWPTLGFMALGAVGALSAIAGVVRLERSRRRALIEATASEGSRGEAR